jgi:hypothetical protein
MVTLQWYSIRLVVMMLTLLSAIAPPASSEVVSGAVEDLGPHL